MNKNDFKSFLKCASDCAWRTVSGSRFQAAGPAWENARSPFWYDVLLCRVFFHFSV